MRSVTSVFLVLAFLFMLSAPAVIAAGAPKGSGALAGHIYAEDMKTPVRNAVVKLRNLETQKEYASEPTDPSGLYRIPSVEEGRYVMGVRGPNGNYNFHYSIMIKGDAVAKLSVAMKPGESPVKLEQGSTAKGKKPTILDFFTSPAGILTIIAAAEMTLFAFALSEDEASPIY